MTWMPGLLKAVYLRFSNPTKALRRQRFLDAGPWRLWDEPFEDLRKQDVSAFVSSSSGQLGRLPRLFEACLVLRPTLTRSCLGFKGSKLLEARRREVTALCGQTGLTDDVHIGRNRTVS